MHFTARRVATAASIAALLAIGPMSLSPVGGEASNRSLPAPPADGTMGFVVDYFVQPVIQEAAACPQGTSPKLREAYLLRQTPEERARLSLKENEAELNRLWMAEVRGPGESNICTNPDMFERPMLRTVQSPHAWGLDLDGAGGGEACAQPDFTTPAGQSGIDNQEYRAMGCTLEWRGTDGIGGDQEVGMRQFHASGEWTQVILLRGVDSLVRDDDVEVVYANTPDRPPADSMGKFLRWASFSVSDKAPRNRNVLRGRIADGVLTTLPQDIALVQTWGQGGARDIRGNRTKFDFRSGRLRLEFQSDGSIKGMLGGYRPVFDVIQSPALGGIGSALVAGIDCAGVLRTLRAHADGLKNPRTGKCEGISAAIRINAIPAFVNDVPARVRTAAR